MSVNTDHVVIATEDADVTGTPKTSSSTDVEKRFLDLLEGIQRLEDRFNLNWISSYRNSIDSNPISPS